MTVSATQNHPTSWTVALIGEISCETVQRIPGSQETFLYIDISSIDREWKVISRPQRLLGNDAPSRARKVVRSGDVLVSMTRPNLNAVAIVPPELNDQIASTGFDVLRANAVEPYWLFYYVRSREFIESMTAKVQGALYPAVRSADIRQSSIPLAPLNEQRRIIAKLDALLERTRGIREKLDHIPVLLDTLRNSVLVRAVRGDLTRHINGGSTDTWHRTTIGKVLLDTRYGTAKRCSELAHGTAVLRIPNVTSRGLDISDLKYAEFDAKERERLCLRAGDLLMIRSNGSVELVGRTGVVTEREAGMLFAGYLMRLRVNPELILPEFLHVWLASPLLRAQIELTARSTSGVNNINSDEVRALPITLPPINEQAEICRRVSALLIALDRISARTGTLKYRHGALNALLLFKAFSGELVPQDPKDEPASMLLERVRAQRAQARAQGKRHVDLQILAIDHE
ncbi:restriction endonuclease subunit S [Burkholderia sp. MSMB1498]|uniref:restriction endonuclease subunit S n=1 Tax=Burkholderia sp. MSMB1498 TaxID=1637842 RepID=UPI000B32DAE4|nr:restriction endonuclease subunit S [Burkholderia sp. MSMB1498]